MPYKYRVPRALLVVSSMQLLGYADCSPSSILTVLSGYSLHILAAIYYAATFPDFVIVTSCDCPEAVLQACHTRLAGPVCNLQLHCGSPAAAEPFHYTCCDPQLSRSQRGSVAGSCPIAGANTVHHGRLVG